MPPGYPGGGTNIHDISPVRGGEGGPGGSAGGSVEPEPPPVNEDFSRDADFLKLFMELPHFLRHGIGHLHNEVESSSLGVNISGMIAGCTYKGGGCKDEK